MYFTLNKVQHIHRLLLFLGVLLFLASCKEEKIVQVESGFVLTSDSLSYLIKEQFDKWTVLMCQDQLPYMDTLEHYYSQRDYSPIWWDEITGDSASWESLRKTIAHSTTHGLDSLNYHLGLIDYYKNLVPEMKTSDKAYRTLAELELILSNMVLVQYPDIANGRTDPEKVYGYTYMLPRNNLKDLELWSYLEQNNKSQFLDKIHYGDTAYVELQALLEVYLERKEAEENQTIDFSKYPKLEEGDTAEVIPLIVKRLQGKILPDSSVLNLSSDTLVYTKKLKSVIRELQEMYQLTPDGIMGFKTYKIINASSSDKINQIQANLERQRWFKKPKKGPFVYINLPKYEIEMHWEDSAKSMRVCIGKNLPDNYDAMVKEYTDSGWLYKLPRNMETPQIASKISYLVINPTWTVPYSIVKREMWWRLVSDSTYLRNKGFKVYKGKEEIRSESIDWSKVDKEKIPYRIVESPGPKNSLGTVKYMFGNPFSIYLHDTPSKSAFKRTQRAVSHGCVRLEDPILFGEFLMQNSKEYDPDDFRIMMGYEPKDPERLENYDPTDTLATIQKLEETTSINLNKRMSLYLDYRTVYFTNDWKPRFCYDIYNQNRLILEALNN